jgi:cytochrome c oxidase subunit I
VTKTVEPEVAGLPEPEGPEPIVARPFPATQFVKGSLLSRMLGTTDHKLIGRMYMVTSLIFFAIGGVMALLMRAELARPGMQFLTPEQYNQLITMHGTIMLLLFATPIVFAFANLVLPLQIGSPDVAFPRLNAFSYWLFLFGGIMVLVGFLTPGGAADAGWTMYSPLNSEVNSPGAGTDLWIIGLVIAGLGTILGGVNMVTTVITLRAPGMTMFRMPIFTWNIMVTSLLILLAFPILTAALLVLWIDRHMGAQVFDPQNGGAILWQHLFWFFGHPEVYIVAIPFFGIVTEVIPVFSRKPLFGYKGMVFATLSIAALSLAVWAHHMFTTGAVLLPFFSLMTFLIAIPTGIKFFNWIGSMWRGAVTFETPMMFALGFMVTFLFGGLTGVLLASPPLDFQVSDTYFVVAHFHYVLFGTIVFAVYSGFYFWFPKYTGRYLDEKLGKVHFWMTFLGFHLTFLVQHWLGAEGMPRRYADYLPSDGFTTLNTVSTIGAFVLGASLLPFVYNIYKSYRFGEVTTAEDPWGYGNSLEWATATPPPRHNFTSIPRIRSERPAFEYHYPHLLERLEAEAHAGPVGGHGRTGELVGASVGSHGDRDGHRDVDPNGPQ